MAKSLSYLSLSLSSSFHVFTDLRRLAKTHSFLFISRPHLFHLVLFVLFFYARARVCVRALSEKTKSFQSSVTSNSDEVINLPRDDSSPFCLNAFAPNV